MKVLISVIFGQPSQNQASSLHSAGLLTLTPVVSQAT